MRSIVLHGAYRIGSTVIRGYGMSDITDALETLITSEGWRILCASARQEWTTRERNGRKAALNDTDDKRALDKLRQITAAQEAVEWVLALPKEEIQRLKRQEQEPLTLPDGRTVQIGAQLAMMSRRGTL